jgi:hypothetical protein
MKLQVLNKSLQISRNFTKEKKCTFYEFQKFTDIFIILKSKLLCSENYEFKFPVYGFMNYLQALLPIITIINIYWVFFN